MVRDAPYMHLPILLAATVFSFALLLAAMRLARDYQTQMLIFAFWLRYVMSAYHFITYKPLVGGLSLNAFASLLVIAIGAFIIKRRCLRRIDSLYLLVFFGAILLSGLVNARFLGSVNSIIKFMYLFTLTFLAYEAFRNNGAPKVLRLLSIAFVMPVVLQLVSYLAGPVKATEVDGSASYIGGYYHEAAFSIVLVTFLFVTCFARVGSRYTIPLSLIGVIGLVAANYRTSILATAPSLLVFFIASSSLSFKKSQRSAITFGFIVVGGVAFILAAALFAERFKDLVVLLGNPESFIKPAENFTTADKKILSGRAWIWSVYLTPWFRAGATKILFGFGPDSWQELFHLYAHNTFVSFAYELGVIGLTTFLALLSRTTSLAMRLKGAPRAVGLAAISSFILINMATMPLWQIEGNLLFALIMAYIWYMHDITGSTSADSFRTKVKAVSFACGK